MKLLLVLTLIFSTVPFEQAYACSTSKGADLAKTKKQRDREIRKGTRRIKGVYGVLETMESGSVLGLVTSDNRKEQFYVIIRSSDAAVISCYMASYPDRGAEGVFFISRLPNADRYYVLVDWEGEYFERASKSEAAE